MLPGWHFLLLCQAGQLAPYLSSPHLAMAILAMTSRLDYCNLCYVGLPLKLTQKPQLIESIVMQLLMVPPGREHIQPLLHKLH